MGPTIVKPGSTLGMLGGGQLGRMSSIAAARLGFKVAVLGDFGRDDDPAGHVAWWAKSWGEKCSDMKAIDEFASIVKKGSGVVTLEWENVPVSLVGYLEKEHKISVRPGAHVLKVAQDRLLEKECAQASNILTANYQKISSGDELWQAARASSFPAILKTRHGGYDGKGQVRVRMASELAKAWDELKNVPCVLEEVVKFACEISVIVARKSRAHGADDLKSIWYGPIENRHRGGILWESQYPSISAQAAGPKAVEAALTIANALDVWGLLAVEFFVTKDGNVIFNEMAPRPHNSGHLTIDTCWTDQFEQHIRAVCGWPWGSPKFHSSGTMVNLLGDAVNDWTTYITQSSSKIHIYGKSEIRDGRKMGHVTRVRSLP